MQDLLAHVPQVSLCGIKIGIRVGVFHLLEGSPNPHRRQPLAESAQRFDHAGTSRVVAEKNQPAVVIVCDFLIVDE